MTALAPCPVCRRHVRVSDARCPFCDSPVRSASLAAIAVAGLAIAGCIPAAVYAPPPAPAYGPPPMTKHCPDGDLLITMDWSPSDRADFEVTAHSGAVVLRRTGCEVEVLRNCIAPGSYRYQGAAAVKSETVVHAPEELHRLLPSGGDRLERFAQSPEGIRLTAVTAGRLALDAMPSRDALQGDCARATHVVTEFRVGAFEVASGKEKLASGGALDACVASEPGAAAAPKACREVLRLELARLPGE